MASARWPSPSTRRCQGRRWRRAGRGRPDRWPASGTTAPSSPDRHRRHVAAQPRPASRPSPVPRRNVVGCRAMPTSTTTDRRAETRRAGSARARQPGPGADAPMTTAAVDAALACDARGRGQPVTVRQTRCREASGRIDDVVDAGPTETPAPRTGPRRRQTAGTDERRSRRRICHPTGPPSPTAKPSKTPATAMSPPRETSTPQPSTSGRPGRRPDRRPGPWRWRPGRARRRAGAEPSRGSRRSRPLAIRVPAGARAASRPGLRPRRRSHGRSRAGTGPVRRWGRPLRRWLSPHRAPRGSPRRARHSRRSGRHRLDAHATARNRSGTGSPLDRCARARPRGSRWPWPRRGRR